MAREPSGRRVKFFCACGQKLSFPEASVDLMGRCPRCRRKVRISDPAGPTGRVVPPRPSGTEPDLLFGTIAVDAGYLPRDRLNAAVEHQNLLRERGIHRTLGEILVEQGALGAGNVEWIIRHQSFVSVRAEDRKFGALAVRNRFLRPEQVKAALQHQRDAYQGNGRLVRIGTLLTERGLLSRQQVDALLAAQARLKTPRRRPESRTPGEAEADVETRAFPAIEATAAEVPLADLAEEEGPGERILEAPGDGDETIVEAAILEEDEIDGVPPPKSGRRPRGVPAAPSAASRRAGVDEEVEPEAVEKVERVEEMLERAAGLAGEEREAALDDAKRRLARVTQWAKTEMPRSRFMGRIYHCWGSLQDGLGERRYSFDAYLNAFDLGRALSRDTIFELGRYLVADRRTTSAALRLYSEFCAEIPYRLDQIPPEDRERILLFFLEAASDFGGADGPLRSALARALAASFAHSAAAQLSSARWMMREQRWAEADVTLQAAWNSPEVQEAQARRVRAEVACELGRVRRAQGNAPEAVEFFERSTELDPLQVLAYVESAEAMLGYKAGTMQTDSIMLVRQRARLSKALRGLKRAEENSRHPSVGARESWSEVGARISKLRETLDLLMGG
ncbi:MAG: hypothetical protein HYY93_01990 [Planctomycetes bacterium]|nr:hypothetical protein [Planctomycetota bacterium]